MKKRLIATAACVLAGCQPLGTLEGSNVEPMTVDGRKFEVRMTSTDTPDEYRLLIYRATMVLEPDRELEYDRAVTVARRVMDRTCKGRPYDQAIETLSGVNYRTVFRCT